ncbi:hypothetical protein LX32DRAFT_425567 [Colletotrichum zoysiae]|uniref:Uncharacterized protein n=1 Tax=Colletotrichum zoysiae TaxID=1216348 RepID=A0AAD9HFE9_9PEZI|nr:hypothetical protein LX32DRAFT_425567 [Colletotrichum zoysiae]
MPTFFSSSRAIILSVSVHYIHRPSQALPSFGRNTTTTSAPAPQPTNEWPPCLHAASSLPCHKPCHAMPCHTIPTKYHIIHTCLALPCPALALPRPACSALARLPTCLPAFERWMMLAGPTPCLIARQAMPCHAMPPDRRTVHASCLLCGPAEC